MNEKQLLKTKFSPLFSNTTLLLLLTRILVHVCTELMPLQSLRTEKISKNLHFKF